MKLWIIGSSFCLPFDLVNPDLGWPKILSEKIGAECKNLSQPAADNFYIYHCYLENLPDMRSDDIIIIGWSHYSRKSFVLDRTNVRQLDVLDRSIVYKTSGHELIRSRNHNPVFGIDKFFNLAPRTKDITYYDHWFENYYSEHEQICNQQAYMDSVRLTCPGKYINFFFSKNSSEKIRTNDHAGFIVDFIMENKVSISANNGHLNEQGHALWAEHLLSLCRSQ